MPVSNFPGGFANGISIRGVPLLVANPGRVFWVYNGSVIGPGQRGGSDNNRGTYDSPFATLQGAIDQCTAARGDIIFVRPGHAETITTATALAFNKAGVSIVGLGGGAARPTLTFTTADTGTIAVSADNVSLSNFLFVGNFLSIASVFTLAAALEFSVEACEFRDTSAILGFLTIVTTSATANAANGLRFVGNRIYSRSVAATAAVIIAGTTNRLTIEDNFINHTGANNNVAAVLEHGALVCDNVSVQRNRIQSVNTDTATGALIVKTTATTGSGIIADNYSYHLDVAAAILVTAAAVQYGLFNNLSTGDTGTSGYVLPAIGAN